MLKFGLSEKHSKIRAIFLMVHFFSKRPNHEDFFSNVLFSISNKEYCLFSKIGMLIIIADTKSQDLKSAYFGKYTKMQ